MENKLKDMADRLPRAESTFYDVTGKADATTKKTFTVSRIAAVCAVLLLMCSVVYAGITEADLGAWADYSSKIEDVLNVSEELGITVPQEISENVFYNMSTLYVVPDGTSYIEAVFTPAYKWYSVDYRTDNAECDDSYASAFVLNFGDTKNELWKYVFGADNDGNFIVASENRSQTEEYNGIYLHTGTKCIYDNDALIAYSHAVKWHDSQNDTVFVLRHHSDTEVFPEILMESAKTIVDMNM